MGMKGLEPSRREALVPKTSVSTNSTTSPDYLQAINRRSCQAWKLALLLAMSARACGWTVLFYTFWRKNASVKLAYWRRSNNSRLSSFGKS